MHTRFWCRNLRETYQFGLSRCKGDDNLKMFTKTDGDADRSDLVQDRDKWLAVVNTAMNLRDL